MDTQIRIPVFPLAIFPIPGEMVPLHIFEPRYQQLLKDAEERDISFGIYFNHAQNTRKLGSLVKLESVMKRYPGGELDIIVKCLDLFSMGTLFRTFKEKLYPGGDVEFWQVDLHTSVGARLSKEFEEFRQLLKIPFLPVPCSVYSIAGELNLDFEERLKFVSLNLEKQESYLSSQLKYQKYLLSQADKARDVFHLN